MCLGGWSSGHAAGKGSRYGQAEGEAELAELHSDGCAGRRVSGELRKAQDGSVGLLMLVLREGLRRRLVVVEVKGRGLSVGGEGRPEVSVEKEVLNNAVK